MLQGQVTISSGSSSRVIGTVHTGETCGEVALLSARHHSATATAVNDIEVAELFWRDLEDLIRRRPDIGVIIYRNLAVGLGDKLLRSGDRRPDQEPNEPRAFLLLRRISDAERDQPASAVAVSPWAPT